MKEQSWVDNSLCKSFVSPQLEVERSSNASLKEQLSQLQREYDDASQIWNDKEQELTSTLQARPLCKTLLCLSWTD